ncbi:adenylate/guanylate cyclase domain-containing protein [Nocardia sp. 348MFTsu5.1]|uniref:adenylate/guanylate cyclase domain-containing protein n=1 Tax=Nocardia sp. 348MFTsu5.1 TaxID=1172185 RepID=UPI0012DBEB00|nr:adenylate/guanylate cyclase domain-containing protein [Nocardia sp. 348MFTsu5.1]
MTAHPAGRRSRLADAFRRIRSIDSWLNHYVDVPDPSLDGPVSRRQVANRLVILAGIGITVRNLVATVETVIMIQLVMTGGELSIRGMIDGADIPVMICSAGIGVLVGSLVATAVMYPQLTWFVKTVPASPDRRRSIQMMPLQQAGCVLLTWGIGALIYIPFGLDGTAVEFVVFGSALLMAAVSAACLTYLLVERVSRPLVAIALRDGVLGRSILGVRERLIAVWTVFCAVPLAGIIAINVGRLSDWLPASHYVIDVPTVVLASFALIGGVRGTVLVSRSITDPLGEIRNGMERVRAGQSHPILEVYDSSELGIVQQGFNDMVSGLAEREQIRELFQRHVGDGVAKLALEQGAGFHGENTFVGVIFVDVQGSTKLAEQEAPETVATLLNSFFAIVAEVVDRHSGFINKFEGDAALAIFGAPTAVSDPAGSALAAARELYAELEVLRPLHFSIGVSAGTVFAGNIGAVMRYEYTVIGDTVNEAARLSEAAKSVRAHVLASGSAIDASDDEHGYWDSIGTLVLRGRAVPTKLYTIPLDREQGSRSLKSLIGTAFKVPTTMSGVVGDGTRSLFGMRDRR